MCVSLKVANYVGRKTVCTINCAISWNKPYLYINHFTEDIYSLAVNALSLDWQRIHKFLKQDSRMSSVKDDTSERKKSLVQRKTKCYDQAIWLRIWGIRPESGHGQNTGQQGTDKYTWVKEHPLTRALCWGQDNTILLCVRE